jgi:hypothetical protein
MPGGKEGRIKHSEILDIKAQNVERTKWHGQFIKKQEKMECEADFEFHDVRVTFDVNLQLRAVNIDEPAPVSSQINLSELYLQQDDIDLPRKV